MSEATDVIATGAEVGYSHFNKKSDDLLWKKKERKYLKYVWDSFAEGKHFSSARVLSNII